MKLILQIIIGVIVVTLWVLATPLIMLADWLDRLIEKDDDKECKWKDCDFHSTTPETLNMGPTFPITTTPEEWDTLGRSPDTYEMNMGRPRMPKGYKDEE